MKWVVNVNVGVLLLITILGFGCKKNGTRVEPESLELCFRPTHVSIEGGSDGSIDLTVSGGIEPYTILWSTGETTEDIENLSVGVYSVIVIDSDNQNVTDSIEIYLFDALSVADFNGNLYPIVKIGNQWWMAENLKATHSPGGVQLHGAYAYNDDENLVNLYGRLYTWEAARSACPTGWHLPSDTEWNTLLNTIGSNSVFHLIEGGSSGFNAKLGGVRLTDGTYTSLGVLGAYWTSTASDADHAVQKLLVGSESEVIADNTLFNVGLSVRCIKD